MNKKIVSLSEDEKKANTAYKKGKSLYIGYSYPFYEEAWNLSQNLRNDTQFLKELAESIAGRIKLPSIELGSTKGIGYFSLLGRENELLPLSQDAIEMMKAAIKQFPDRLDFLVTMGDVMVQQGNYEKAIEYYRKASQSMSDDDDIVRLKYYFSITVYNRASWLTPVKKYERAYEIYLMASGKVSEEKEAIPSEIAKKGLFYHRIKHIHEEISNGCLSLGRTLLNMKRYPEAIRCLKAVRGLDLDRQKWFKRRYLTGLGDAYFGNGELTQALDCYTKVQEINIKEFETGDEILKKIAKVKMKIGLEYDLDSTDENKKDEALRYLSEAVKFYNEGIDKMTELKCSPMLCSLYLDNVITCYEKILRLDAKNIEANEALLILKESGNEKARIAFIALGLIKFTFKL